MTKRLRRFRLAGRRGLALPMAIIFCVLMASMVYYMTRTRVEQKRQNLTQFSALQADFLAQGAVQQALLKFRVLPTEAYGASAIARGLCPFYVAPPGSTPQVGPGKSQDPLDTFVSDINADAVPLRFAQPEFSGWHCEIASSKALTSFTTGTETVNVVSIEAVGIVPIWVKHPLTGEWESRQYQGKVKKTVEVRRTK